MSTLEQVDADASRRTDSGPTTEPIGDSSNPGCAEDPRTESRTEPSASDAARFWVLALLVSVIIAGLLPLIQVPRFYFHGDTQAGSFGQWFHLGQELLAGRWPIIDPQSWRAGNFIAEGQWGLYSPLTVVIALFATQAGNAVVFVTVVKLGLLSAGAIGAYLVVRSYAAPPWAGYVAGLTVTLGGFTRYLESPSWVTGQMIWALLPLFWWALRRMILHRASPAPALVFGFLIVTVGYVYGCLYIAIVVVGCTVDLLLRQDRAALLRVVGVGVTCAMLAVPVYLPGVLTASTTTRSGFEISSDGPMTGDLLGMITAILPFRTPAVYVAWFIPMLAWLDPSRLRRLGRPLAGALVILALALAWFLGPQQIGPIRWPSRVAPLVVMIAVPIICVLLSRARLTPLPVSRLVLCLLWALAAGWLVASRNIGSVGRVGLFLLVAMIGLTLAWFILRRHRESSSGFFSRLPVTTMLALFIGVWSIGTVALQYAFFPRPFSVDRNMPARVADYSMQAATATGDVMVVGDPQDAAVADPAVAKDFLIASSWFVSPQTVQSTYSTIGFRAYNARFCIWYNGSTCRSSLKTLFSEEPTTGARRIDLLSVSSLQIFRPDFSEKRLADPPSGWRVSQNTPHAVTWVREDPLPTAGGVSWSSRGTKVREISNTDESVTLSVDEVGPDGGTVVLSRLAWPGYRVTGADLTDPVDDYLLAVRIPPNSQGTIVRVDFQPPGWLLGQCALVLALGIALSWSLIHLVPRRRHAPPGRSGDASQGPA